MKTTDRRTRNHDERTQAARLAICTSLVVSIFAVAGVVLYLCNPALLALLCQEDSLVESATAALYLVAAILFVYANRSFALRNIWLWMFALLFFVIAGEEISWGQRLLGLETPTALAEINVQEETNLHNIEGIHGSVRALALLVIFGICFVIPTLNVASASMRRLNNALAVPIFPLWASGMVVLAILFMAVPRLVFGVIVFELDELGELILAVAFVMFGVSVTRSTEIDQRSASPARLASTT